MRGKWAETRPARELLDLNAAFLTLLRRGDPERAGFGLDPGSWKQLFGLSHSQLDVLASTPCLLAAFADVPLAPAAAGPTLGVAEPGPLHLPAGTPARRLASVPSPGGTPSGNTGARLSRSAGSATPEPAEPASPASARHDAPRPHMVPARTGQPGLDRHGYDLRMFTLGLLTWLWQTARQDPLLATLCTGPDGLVMDTLGQMSFAEIQRAGASASCLLEARFCRHRRLWPDLLHAVRSCDRRVIQATQLSVVQLTLVHRSAGQSDSSRGELRTDGAEFRGARRPDSH